VVLVAGDTAVQAGPWLVALRGRAEAGA
jgi:hypothetical protein